MRNPRAERGRPSDIFHVRANALSVPLRSAQNKCPPDILRLARSAFHSIEKLYCKKGRLPCGNCPHRSCLSYSLTVYLYASVYVYTAQLYTLLPSSMNLISLSVSSFSYAIISSSGISPLEKIFAMETYCDSFDFKFSLSPSPVTSSTFHEHSFTTLKNPSISVMF